MAAAYTIAIVPQPILRQLTGRQLTVLRCLLMLASVAKPRPNGRAPRVQPGRAWLAEQAGLSTSHVSRVIKRLREHGLIDYRQQRQGPGQWRTNVYWIGSTLKGVATAIARGLKRPRVEEQAGQPVVVADSEEGESLYMDLEALQRQFERNDRPLKYFRR